MFLSVVYFILAEEQIIAREGGIFLEKSEVLLIFLKETLSVSGSLRSQCPVAQLWQGEKTFRMGHYYPRILLKGDSHRGSGQ